MAKKNNKSGPPVETVQTISPEQMAAAGGSFTNSLATGAVKGNIKGGQMSGAQGYIDLTTGGALSVNPLLQQQYNSEFKALNTEGKKLLSGNTRIDKQIAALQKQLENPRLSDTKKSALEQKLASLNSTLASNEERLKVINTEITGLPSKIAEGQPSIASALEQTLAPTFAQVDKVRGMLGEQGKVGAAGQAFMDYVGKGFTPGQITSRDVTAAQMSAIPNISADQVRAAQMGDFGAANAVSAGNVANISAGTVGQGMLGGQLMNRAMEGIQRGGMLSEQATRDAIQSARQGFAARGLATGNAALGAELLNRDRYARVRELEDLGFASNVQGQDLSRQFQNVGNQLTADRSNQQTQLGISLANQQAAMQAELANLDARYKAAVQQGDWEMAADAKNQAANLTAAQSNQQTAYNVGALNTQQQNTVGLANADRDLRKSMGQEEANRLGTQLGANLLGQGMGAEQMYQDRGLAAGMQLIDLNTQYNPTMMAMGFDPYGGKTAGTQAMGPAASMANTWATNAANTGMFNANANNWASGQQWMMNNMPSMQSGGNWLTGGLAGGLGGAALGFQVGGPTGALVGGVGGFAAGAGASQIR
jgi:hypothetical protein